MQYVGAHPTFMASASRTPAIIDEISIEASTVVNDSIIFLRPAIARPAIRLRSAVWIRTAAFFCKGQPQQPCDFNRNLGFGN